MRWKGRFFRERKKQSPKHCSLPYNVQEGNTPQLHRMSSLRWICWVPEVLFNPILPICDSKLQVPWVKGLLGMWLLAETIHQRRESPYPLLMDLSTSLCKDHWFSEIIVLVTGSYNWLLWLGCLGSDSLRPPHLCHFLWEGLGGM